MPKKKLLNVSFLPLDCHAESCPQCRNWLNLETQVSRPCLAGAQLLKTALASFRAQKTNPATLISKKESNQ